MPRLKPARQLACLAATAAAAAGLAGPAAASTQTPDPARFTPAKYTFCGWFDYDTKAWTTEYQSKFGATDFDVLFARGESCRSARRNEARLHWTVPQGQVQPVPHRPGYSCAAVADSYDYSDYRCAKRGARPRAAFRWRRGVPSIGWGVGYTIAPTF